MACPCGAEPDNVADTTLCALYESPAPYAGKFIRVRARVVGNDLRDLWIEDVAACSAPTSYMFMLAELPENVLPKPPFSLELDTSFAEFRNALTKHVALMATLEGRFDAVFVWREKKHIRLADGKGFGKKHKYDGRLVLREISDVKTIYLPYR